MLPVEVVRHYQEIIGHLLDEIQELQMERIDLRHELQKAQTKQTTDSTAESESEQ